MIMRLIGPTSFLISPVGRFASQSSLLMSEKPIGTLGEVGVVVETFIVDVEAVETADAVEVGPSEESDVGDVGSVEKVLVDKNCGVVAESITVLRADFGI